MIHVTTPWTATPDSTVETPCPVTPWTEPALLSVLRTPDVALRRRSAWQMADPEEGIPFARSVIRVVRGTRAVNVVKRTPPPPTWVVISRPIVAWTVSWPRSVHIVTRCTWACQLYPCTSWRTASNTSVLFVTRLSPDPGYFRATWDLTLERSLMDVLIVVKPSPTAPTFALTCKLTPPSSTTRVNDVTSPSLSSPTSTNITSLPASKTRPNHN